jgi:hypothetical protein
MSSTSQRLVALAASVFLFSACESSPTEPVDSTAVVANARLSSDPFSADRNGDGKVCRADDGSGYTDNNRKRGCRTGFTLVIAG